MEWVALLRGVNVGGITIRSADLAATFRELGFEAVRTVLASGNVVFETAATASARPKLKSTIEKALRDRFGYDAWILLVTAVELRAAADAFPFDEDDATRQPWVIFCVDAKTRDELIEAARETVPTPPPLAAGASSGASGRVGPAAADPVAPGPGVVYWNPVKGTTVDTPFGKLLGKAAYKPRTTNRNLRTLRKIIG